MPIKSKYVDCVCDFCSKNFQVTEYRFSKGRGKFCSKQCFNNSIAIPIFSKNCQVCDIKFDTKRPDALFCSSICFGTSLKSERVLLICFVCKKQFEREDYYVKRLKDLNLAFCSHSCASSYSGQTRYEKRLLKCLNCGKEETINESDRREKYCSQECYKEHDKERLAIWAPQMGRDNAEKISDTKTKNWINGKYDNSPKFSYAQGKYLSTKMNREMVYRSSWEKQYMEYLDKSSEVVFFENEKIRIPYEGTDNHRRNYIPDFRINGIKIVEIKPNRFKDSAINALKFAAARKYCEENNMIFEVITEVELKQLGISVNRKKQKVT